MTQQPQVAIEPLAHPYTKLQPIAEQMEKQRLSCEAAAKRYLPKGPIEYLLIGESPPISGSYFYKADDLRPKAQSLPAKVFRGFFGTNTGLSKPECERCLEKLRDKKFFLTDWCPYPIDMFTASHRVTFLRDELAHFVPRYESLSLSTSAHVIMVLPSATRKELNRKPNRDVLRRLEAIGVTEKCFVAWSQLEEVLSRL